MNNSRSITGARWLLMFLLMIIFPVMLSCSLTGSIGQAPTSVLVPTQPPQVTVLVVVQSPTPEAVLPPTETSFPTETVVPPSPTPETPLPTETIAATPLPEFIEIKNIDGIGFHFANSTKCKDEKEGCWILTTYKQKASLEQKDYIYVDPNWTNPYLVFDHKYNSEGYSFFGYMEMTADNEVGWSQKRGFKKSVFNWVEEAFDLNEYKGHEILFRIKFSPTSDVVSKNPSKFNFHDWYITPFKIVPNYQP